ncbi:cyclic dehypoxanthinyl futalosine synthase [Pontiella sulfatireligans]|uniref:Cyclic dehypoxanthine futalosine synthase n=1 Tax=Pontiella sulfatireligans TaxID=2750658 RepID=A0A6C2UPF5_9BACT|nr:cyclic dehypoxanthinyl futalosine synthase [Pontiella sulfatireligans]VGO20896.1 Cyclic dehypoxanthine futalosine synthase [Pontiella sulfatireligans]
MSDFIQKRISDAEALDMLQNMPTAELMARADAIRRARHGNKTYYVHSHNLNPTNLCVVKCKLCSFWRPEGADDAYITSLDDARKSLEKAQNWNLTDLHIVGGMIPELDMKYYEDLFSLSREMLPGVLLQGMTAVEIHWIAGNAGIPVRECLERLKACGFGSISGGGAEIFHPDIRKKIATTKILAQQWLDVHKTAHELGIPTNATMLFGHIEKDEHLIDHLSHLRQQQDETGGFQAVIPLPFQANGKALGVQYTPSGDRQVRVAAISRIYCDNFPHVRMLVNYMDRKLLGVLTHSGVDDIGGTSLDERIAKAGGAPQSQKFFSAEEMGEFLINHGHTPVLTNSAYEQINGQPDVDAIPAVPAVSSRWKTILDRVEAGERINAFDAQIIYDEAPFQELGRVADICRRRAVPGDLATYVFDKNLNTTNVCVVDCKFCAFYTKQEKDNAYVKSPEEIVEQVKAAAEEGATQILIQGGLHPDLKLDYYEKCLSGIRDNVDIWIHSLSPTEIEFVAKMEHISIKECLQRLKDAGLQSLPGGGAEILNDEVRKRISPKKTRSKAWLHLMEDAHSIGLKTTATMVYGFGETYEQRIEHFMKVRDLQDRTGGFTAFIPWSFSPDMTDLDCPRRQNGIDYLRLVAMARIILDNVPHLQAGWVTEGPDVSQLALQFGADDYGGVLMTEEVVSATGVDYKVDEDLVVHLIREAGWVPAQRTTQYDLIKVHGEEVEA